MRTKYACLALSFFLAGCSGSDSSVDAASEAAAAAAETKAAADAAEAAARSEPERPQMTPEQKKEGEEMIALLLNLNSLLCAKVVEVNPLKVRPGVLEVKCIEYRGGTATKNYIVDTNNGTAFLQ